MKKAFIAFVICGALGVAGCTNPDRFGPGYGGDSGAAGVGAGGVGDGSGISGSALDPSSIQYFQQTVGDRVLFDVDQSTLNASARVLLDGQADWLLANPSYTAVVEGHADEQGTRDYNLALGARRANAVREYLVSRGVAGSRVESLTFGKERPIAVCSKESCYNQNRRAVTVVAGGFTS